MIMFLAVAAISGQAAQGDAKKDSTAVTENYRTLKFASITGDTTDLAAFDGRVVLIVNTASKCGYTPQYAGLEELYQTYKDSGLVVIGFPANNFGGQEPGSNEQILQFCTSRFDVTFPMMAKVSVKGADKHPLFKYLTEESPLPGEIKWNFSKFLLDRDGRLVARWDSAVKPMSDEIVKAVKEAL
jgi:glutathione peroxidase